MIEDSITFEQRGIVGQRSAIRRLNVQDPDDLRRLRMIDISSGHIKWFFSRPEMFIPLKKDELIDFASDQWNHFLYGISGSEAHDQVRNNHETGKLQGWVKVNPDEDSRVAQLQKLGLLEEGNKEPVIEVSYAKLPDAPSGQMASGLRQVCVEIAGINAELRPDRNFPSMKIVAYVIDDDRGNNEESVKVLEVSGFEEKGRVRYDEDAPMSDRVFILNWEKLDAILKNKAPIN